MEGSGLTGYEGLVAASLKDRHFLHRPGWIDLTRDNAASQSTWREGCCHQAPAALQRYLLPLGYDTPVGTQVPLLLLKRKIP